MDKNSIIGLLVIGGILVGWMVMAQPSKEELAKQQAIKDSVALFDQTQKTKAEAAAKTIIPATTTQLTSVQDTLSGNPDSVKKIIKQQIYGGFADASEGENKIITLENELMKVSVSSKGGRISSVELKTYKTFDGKPLILFDADSSTQNLSFTAYSKKFSTDSLFFTADNEGFSIKDKESKSLSMRLYAGSKAKYIEYVYGLTGNEYMMTFRVNTVGFQDIIAPTEKGLTLNWQMKTPMQEQSASNQRMNSTVYYKQVDENVDK
nr:YidC/Oxa1 family insertase periplasmic-domain containing protein [Bacteroidota bacterium]